MLSIESGVLDSLSFDDIIDDFVEEKSRKVLDLYTSIQYLYSFLIKNFLVLNYFI